MCNHHALTFTCGHTQLSLANYCTQAALIQTPCNRSGGIPITLRIEHACPACGGGHGGVAQSMLVGGLSCEKGMKDPRWRRDSMSSAGPSSISSARRYS